MAMTTSHPSARKAWSNLLERSVFQVSFFLDSPLVKRANATDAVPADAVIVMMDELMAGKGANKGSGYVIDYDLEGPLYGYPTAGDNTIQAFNRLSLFSDQIQINQDRFPVQNEGKFADGLVPYAFLDRVRERAGSQFWPHYFDERFVLKSCGAVGVNTWVTVDPTKATASARNVNGSAASDGNDLRAPGSTRLIYGNAKVKLTVTSADGLSLDLIDLAILQAVRPSLNNTLKRQVPVLTIAGKPAVVFMADYRALQSMNANTSNRFYDLQRAEVQGGGSTTKVADWASFRYRSPMNVDVYIVSHPNMVGFSNYGASSNLNAVRCLLLGKGAIRAAMGRDSKDVGSFSWHEREADEGNQIIVTTGVTMGITKAAYNTTETGTVREDYAVVSLDVFVAAA